MNFFEEENEEDDEFIEVNECQCNECSNIFLIPPDFKCQMCPHCGCKFD